MLKTLKELIELMRSRKKQLYASIVLSFVDNFLLIVPMIFAFLIVGSIPELNGDSMKPLSYEQLIFYSILMVLSVVLRMVLRYYTLRLRSGAGYEVMCEQRKLLGCELRSVSMGYFTQKNLGELVSTITSDASYIELDGMGVVEKIATGIPSLIIGLVLLLVFDYRIALAAMLLFIPVYFAYRWVALTQQRLGINRQKVIGAVTDQAVEYVSGLHVLKSYNMGKKQFHKAKNSFEKLKKLSLKLEFSHMKPIAVFQLCLRLITVAIILGSGILAVAGSLSFPAAFLLMLGSFSLFSGFELMGIYSIFSKLAQQSIERIEEIKKIPKMKESSGTAKFEKSDIVFENVTFSYEQKTVLHDISFSVPENTMTALVGMSGSGKTTITNLIARFWDVEDGKVMIGGKNIREIDYEELLKHISFVFQDVFLFNDTVFNNIRIGRSEASEEEVVLAAKRAGCHDFIMKMKHGYDSVVGERGETLSGGERQRISIARALIKDAPIVLLDEVTANLDIENESMIQNAFHELLRNRTVILIAHKLSTIKHVDQILVLEEGSIVQKGTHEQLMIQEGLYKKLWNRQVETSKWRL